MAAHAGVFTRQGSPGITEYAGWVLFGPVYLSRAAVKQALN